MDVITRAEFDDSMKNFLTKNELVSAVREAIRENLDDLKIDLSAQLEEKVTKSHNLLGLSALRTSDLKDAKNEILATMRRNLGEAIEPLKADLGVVKSDVAGLTSDVAGLKSDVAGLTSGVAGLTSDVAGLTSDVAGLKSDVAGLKSGVAGLTSDVAGLKSGVAGLNSDVAGLKSDVAGLRSDMDLGFLKLGARLDEMQDKFKSVADGNKGLDEKLTRFGNDISETLKQHERILDRHDADLFKLRQSGVLQ